MTFSSIIPILCSADIRRSLDYYTQVLGFGSRWEWDDPPTFGGVDHGEVRIFFCKDGQGQPGTWLAINVEDVETYYETIRAKGAVILHPPETYEWGMREMLVADPDGHRIRIGQGISIRHKSEETMPAAIQVTERMPTAAELALLINSAGWSQPTEEAPPEIPLSAIACTVVAEDTVEKQVAGCAFLLTDGAGFYYVKNVIVHPRWQGKRIGTALMQALDRWLEKNAPDNAMVALHTGDHLAPFYRQFGFTKAFSMQKRVRREK